MDLVKSFDALDVATLEIEDNVTATMKDAPWRFGVEHNVDWTMSNSGNWTEKWIPRMAFGRQSPGCNGLSFYLSRFVVPEGGELFVYNGDRTAFFGFNHLNVKEWEGLALSLLEGDKTVLEYREPLSMPQTGEIAVGQVVHGYRSLLRRQQELQAPMPLWGHLETAEPATSTSIVPRAMTGKWKIVRCPIVNGGFAACSGAMSTTQPTTGRRIS